MKNKRHNKNDSSDAVSESPEFVSQTNKRLPFKYLPEGTLIIGQSGAGKSSSSAEDYLKSALKFEFGSILTTIKHPRLKKSKSNKK